MTVASPLAWPHGQSGLIVARIRYFVETHHCRALPFECVCYCLDAMVIVQNPAYSRRSLQGRLQSGGEQWSILPTLGTLVSNSAATVSRGWVTHNRSPIRDCAVARKVSLRQ